jgi:hypothetical protein
MTKLEQYAINQVIKAIDAEQGRYQAIENSAEEKAKSEGSTPEFWKGYGQGGTYGCLLAKRLLDELLKAAVEDSRQSG